MARIRTIKPEFWGDTKIGRLTFAARLLFIGLWNYADDWGRGNYKPKEIEGFIFPDDDVDIRALLQELIDADRIVTYAIGDQRYFVIPSFDKHQPMRDRSQTRIPSPPEEILENPGKSQEIPGNTTLGSRKLEVGSRKLENARDRGKPSTLPADSEDFNRFWEACPRKTAKGAAKTAWAKLHPDAELVERILAALERQKVSDQWTRDEGRFIPHPATWLNQERWEDEPDTRSANEPDPNNIFDLRHFRSS